MRFTASDTYNLLTRAAAKQITWAVWFRSVNSISTTVSGTSGWTDITSRILNFGNIVAKLEEGIGQYTIGNLTFDGSGGQYFKTLLTPATGYYPEIKVVAALSLGSLIAADEVITFSGFIDLTSLVNDEFSDKCTFTAFSVMDYADRIPAEQLTTQYVDSDIVQDMSSVSGLVLGISMVNVFVKSAALTGFPLQLGEHTITREKALGQTKVIFALDGGPPVGGVESTTLFDITLVNPDGTQKIELYANTNIYIPFGSGVETVVVSTVGDTLPRQWYIYPSVRQLLSAIYGKLGLTSITWDTLTYKSGPAAGLSTPGVLRRLSFIDKPPLDSPNVTRFSTAIASNSAGSTICIAVGKKIYARVMGTDTYSLLCTLPDWSDVTKLMYNDRNSHLWILYTSEADSNTYLRRYDVLTSTLQAAVTLTGTPGAVVDYAVWLYDFNYTGSSWHYSIVYADSSTGTYGTIRECDGSAMTLSDVLVGGATQIVDTGRIIYGRSDGLIFFPTHKATDYYFQGMHVNASNVWAADTQWGAGSVLNYSAGCYNPGDTLVYFASKNGADTGKIMSHPYNSGTATLVKARISAADEVLAFASDGARAYWTRFDPTAASPNVISDQVLFYAASGTPVQVSTGVHSKYSTGLCNSNGVMIGLDTRGILYRTDTSVSLSSPVASFSGKSVLQALNETLQSFNLVAIVTASKSVYVYRRNDETGTPVNSGNTLALTISEATDLSEVVQHIKPVEYVVVTGEGGISVNYNGNTYNQTQFSITPNASISSELIPKEILNDLAFHLYMLFNTARNLYSLELGAYPAFQWEPFDASSVTFTTTHVQKSGTGVIYTSTYRRDGSMAVEVLL